MPKIVKQHRKRATITLLSLLAAIVAGGLIYYFLFAGPPEQAITEKAPGWKQPPSQAEQPIGRQPAETKRQQSEQAPSAEATLPPKSPCDETYARISDFFSYLDQRTYVSFYQFKGGSEHHFAQLLTKLFAHPPQVVRETDSLTAILHNATHFYRILGKDNLFLVKDILESEQKIIEPTMADFYQWSLMSGECSGKKHAIRLPLKGLYEYAGFFLNTMGGQSYLFRRSSLVRTLTKYYSVLIIDRANEQGLNTYGIDIRPAIDSLIEEIDAMRNLALQEKYLRVLQNLKIKYQAGYGG